MAHFFFHFSRSFIWAKLIFCPEFPFNMPNISGNIEEFRHLLCWDISPAEQKELTHFV